MWRFPSPTAARGSSGPTGASSSRSSNDWRIPKTANAAAPAWASPSARRSSRGTTEKFIIRPESGGGMYLPSPSRFMRNRMSQDKILIVDDEADIALILKLQLEDSGFKTARARDGLDALDKLARETFDLILLDIKMPRMDGMQVLARIQA